MLLCSLRRVVCNSIGPVFVCFCRCFCCVCHVSIFAFHRRTVIFCVFMFEMDSLFGINGRWQVCRLYIHMEQALLYVLDLDGNQCSIRCARCLWFCCALEQRRDDVDVCIISNLGYEA